MLSEFKYPTKKAPIQAPTSSKIESLQLESIKKALVLTKTPQNAGRYPNLRLSDQPYCTGNFPMAM